MSELMEPNENDNRQGHQLALQSPEDIYFAIHEKINAKNEEVSKAYKEDLLLQYEDIKELHLKTSQTITSFSPKGGVPGLRIAITHNEGESEKFNSFEDFEKHNITNPNPTSSVIFIYSFTIYDEASKQIEHYKITNKLSSRLSKLNQIEKEAPPFISRHLIVNFVSKTAEIKVEHSDYVKARTFIAMFDDWVKGCRKSDTTNKKLNPLKHYSHLIPKFGKLTIYALLAIFTALAVDSSIVDIQSAVKFLVFYISIFVILGSTSKMFLNKIERAIDNNIVLSYINICKGDKNLINKYSKRNKKSFWLGMFGLAGTITLGILSAYIYDIIKPYI